MVPWKVPVSKNLPECAVAAPTSTRNQEHRCQQLLKALESDEMNRFLSEKDSSVLLVELRLQELAPEGGAIRKWRHLKGFQGVAFGGKPGRLSGIQTLRCRRLDHVGTNRVGGVEGLCLQVRSDWELAPLGGCWAGNEAIRPSVGRCRSGSVRGTVVGELVDCVRADVGAGLRGVCAVIGVDWPCESAHVP